MTTLETRPEKRIASAHITAPTFVGIDETGGVHYWSITDRKIAVVEDDAVDTVDLADTDRPLKRWRDHTDAERGWVDCRIDAEQLAGAVLRH